MPPILVAYTYRSLRRMDMTAFCYNILRSKLFSSTVTDAHEYAELFDAEVRRVLDLYTRLCEQVDADAANTITVVCRRRLVKPNSYVVDSNVGIVGLDLIPSDKQAYLSACSAARESILRLCADRIKSELDEVSGDVGATWRTAGTRPQQA